MFILRSVLAVVLFLMLMVVISSCQSDENNSPRTRTKLTTGWKFINQEIENSQAFEFDDSGWRQVNLPHDWAIEGPFTQEVYFQGGFLPYPGVGWYRKTFDISAEDKSVLLEFDGVMMNAKVLR